VITLSGCFKNQNIEHVNSLTLTIRDEYAKQMHYDELPNFTFEFEGTIYTSDNTPQPYYVIFRGNNDFHLSEQISKLFERYADRMEVVLIETKESTTERLNNRDEEGEAVPEFLETDDGKRYYEVAFIELENGMKLSLDYRRFVSGGKNYYVWRYESNISMTLYYPLMVVENFGEKEIVLLTIPNRISYQVGPQLKIANIMKDPDYLLDGKYTLSYDLYTPKEDVLDERTTAEKQQYVIDYYINNFSGEFVGEDIYFSYLGNNFSVILLENYFTIRYMGKA
jgi:hypothetical protein